MKKMLFSTIALVAFTATSMAGEVEFNSDAQPKSYPCTEQWSNDMNTLQNHFGATFEEALVLADKCFEECLTETYGN
jgi:hypothetical protein